MNRGIIFGAVGLIAGLSIGFITGYYASKKKSDEEMKAYMESKNEEAPAQAPLDDTKEVKDEPVVDKASKIVSPGPAKIAMPGNPGIDYNAYAKKVEELKYKAESESPTDGDETELCDEEDDQIDPDDFEETYEEKIAKDNEEIQKEMEVYRKKRKKDFYILKDGVDPEWPDIHFEDKRTLFYLTMDDLLVDEDGNPVNEAKTIGEDIRKYWMHNMNLTDITVRNMREEIDYDIKKEFTDYSDFFGHDLPPIEEDEVNDE